MAALPCGALEITPFIGRAGQGACRSVALTQANAAGSLSFPEDEQTVRVRVLLRGGARQGGARSIELRLMREDAEALRGEIGALLSRERARPILFKARVDRSDACVFYEVAA